jgi:hypothetical protein
MSFEFWTALIQQRSRRLCNQLNHMRVSPNEILGFIRRISQEIDDKANSNGRLLIGGSARQSQ